MLVLQHLHFEEPTVQVKLRGHNVSIRLIIENYQMEVYNGLLFNSTHVKKVDTKGKFQTFRLGNVLQKGADAYIEIIDHGDGYFVLDQMVLGSKMPTSQVSDLTQSLLAGKEISSEDQLLIEYGNLFKALSKEISSNAFSDTSLDLLSCLVNT